MLGDGEILDGCGNQREQRLLPMAVFDRTCSKIVHAQEDGWIHVYDAILLEILDVCAVCMHSALHKFHIWTGLVATGVQDRRDQDTEAVRSCGRISGRNVSHDLHARSASAV